MSISKRNSDRSSVLVRRQSGCETTLANMNTWMNIVREKTVLNRCFIADEEDLSVSILTPSSAWACIPLSAVYLTLTEYRSGPRGSRLLDTRCPSRTRQRQSGTVLFDTLAPNIV
jgi:hypothetical protein